MSRKSTAVLLLGLLLSLLGYWVIGTDLAAVGPMNSLSRDDQSSREGRSTLEIAPVAKADLRASAPRGESLREALVITAPTEGSWMISGTCVGGFGHGIGGVRVRLRIYRDPRAGEDGIPELLTESTATGEFLLRVPAGSEGCEASLSLSKAGLTDRSLHYTAPERDVHIEAGEVILLPTGQLTGLAVDEGGQPAKGVSMRLTHMDALGHDASWYFRGGALAMDDRATFRTDDDGSFESKGRFRAGTWKVTVHSAEFTGCVPDEVEVDLAGLSDLVFVCKRTPRIKGRVVQDRGSLARMRLLVLDAETGESRGTVKLQEDGTFQAFLEKGAEPGRVRIQISPGGRFTGEPVMAQWGDTDVLVSAATLPMLRLRVLDGRTKKPLQVEGLSLTRDASDFAYMPAVYRDGEIVKIGYRQLGDYFLYVTPKLGEGAITGPLPIHFAGALVEVEVTPASMLSVSVVGPDGGPIDKGVRVGLFACRGQEWAASSFSGSSRLKGRPAYHRGTAVSSGGSKGAIWASKWTNPAGKCRLPLPDITGWNLYCMASSPLYGQRIVPLPPGQIQAHISYEGLGELTVRLDRKGFHGLQLSASAVVNGVPFEVKPERHVLEDGTSSFRFGYLDPGTWQLSGSFRQVETVFQNVQIAPGSAAIVSLDRSSLFIDRRRVYVELAGVPLASGTIKVVLSPRTLPDGTPQKRSLNCTVEDGWFELPDMFAGDYTVRILRRPEVKDQIFNPAKDQAIFFE